jgi:hypothetical protein
MRYSEGRLKMKRLAIAAMVVFVLSSAANAALWLSVGDSEVPPAASEITLAPSDTLLLSVWGDGTDFEVSGWILVEDFGGIGNISGGVVTYPGSHVSYREGDECCWPFPCLPELRDLTGRPIVDFACWELIDTADPPAPMVGLLITEIIYHCDGDGGDVVITLIDEDLVTVYSALTIHHYVEQPAFEGDYGDCPGPYPTLLGDDGARHKLDPNIFLGQLIDEEADGQPSAAADGDDANLVDDEDGVVLPSRLGPGHAFDVEVSAWAGGRLDAWIDFNADGDWYDAGEQIFTSFPLQAGKNTLTFNVPAEATLGETYARFRLSRAGGLTPTGPAQDGEVEDYPVSVERCYEGCLGFPDYDDWTEYCRIYGYDRCKCWCGPPEGSGYQCVGDCDGDASGFPYNYRVFTGDLDCVIQSWKRKMGDPELNPCADLDHKSSGFPYNYRVYTRDLEILIANWKKRDADLGPPLCGSCP